MKAYERVKQARAADRPTASRYIKELFTEVTYLGGDRCFGDDPAMVGGIGMLEDTAVTFLGIERGQNLEQRIHCRFGSPMPEGYRKALRLMKQAEKFHRPVLCLVDTAGAYCGAEAEERGQGQAIAANLAAMMGLKVPVISLIIGEGGSGGALGISVADRVYMLENAVYSVISPEGCAGILWKDTKKVEEAAACLRLTAKDICGMGVAEAIIPEDFKHFSAMVRELKIRLCREFRELSLIDGDTLRNNRYNRFRKFGVYESR